ncbi:hypothetical protein EVA_14227 [gut metagenome]|uniref:Uncharacterized protein n=1 Tax=gut metagenome TaxID=749906 RepID=J9G7C1_9ZZZZ
MHRPGGKVAGREKGLPILPPSQPVVPQRVRQTGGLHAWPRLEGQLARAVQSLPCRPPHGRLHRGQRMAVHMARAPRRAWTDRLLRRREVLHHQTRLALLRHGRHGRGGFARHLGPHRTVCPRQRAKPPRPLSVQLCG